MRACVSTVWHRPKSTDRRLLAAPDHGQNDGSLDSELFSLNPPLDLSKYVDPQTRAKRIFYYYACNHFFLDRDDMREEYEEYGITKAQEREWTAEYISFWTDRLSPEDLTAVDRLHQADAWEALPALMKMAPRGDSYAQLWYGNAIWGIAWSGQTTLSFRPRKDRARLEKMYKEAATVSIGLWRHLTTGKITISDEHRAKIAPYVAFLRATTPEGYVVNYAKDKLAEAEYRPI